MLRWFTRLLLALLVLALLGTGWALWRFDTYRAPDPTITPDPAAMAYFKDDYTAARAAFLQQGDALAQRYARVERLAIPVASGHLRDLTVDALYVPAQQTPRRLLILIAGTHGVEGPTGSAVMRLFMSAAGLGPAH